MSAWVLIIVILSAGRPGLAIDMPDKPTCERVAQEFLAMTKKDFAYQSLTYCLNRSPTP